MFPYAAWKSETWKTAARAGLRQIGKMVQSGNLGGASALAKTPGVLKPSVAGSQIRHLGHGGEGLATLTASPQHGVAVRKLYDPRGMSGPEMIARKEQAGRALGDNPHFAKFLGAAQTPHGGQMHFSEFVPTGQAPTGQAAAQSIKHTKTQAQQALTGAGFAGGKDIRRGNMVFDQNTGKHRVIDYIPAQKGEFMRMPAHRENVLATTPDTASPWNPDYSAETEGTSGGMVRRLIGGKSDQGMRQNRKTLAPASPSSPTGTTGAAAGGGMHGGVRPPGSPEGFIGVDNLARRMAAGGSAPGRSAPSGPVTAPERPARMPQGDATGAVSPQARRRAALAATPLAPQ